MGGPPLVSPNRVKVGGLVRKDDDDERDIWFVVMAPRPRGNAGDQFHALAMTELEACMYILYKTSYKVFASGN